ncbi:MAG: MFS transporter [Planctomycetota bacterium]|nr:MFS transporter [Planctomycetota bacterium]
MANGIEKSNNDQVYQPANTLYSRTFIALLIAQFLAAFNDQAIHASAMFFAINKSILNEAQAISLMPILFYAPWAIFCTLAGYLADRYSKQSSLIFWKMAELLITAIALLGFWLGNQDYDEGPWIVLSTVFLMGLHSAFFVPAKYGIMPEILKSHLLSKGNGLLESLSFLAVILGTVFGGVLSYHFKGQEYWIGIILFILAAIGAIASLWIEKIPAANPDRKFPPYLYQPVYANLKEMFRSRPLAIAVIGIAFFTFIVAFSRATIYMHGESQLPRWSEQETSVIVGMVALGIGFGSPLVGYLSGGKIEMGLIPIGIIGMVFGLISEALFLDHLGFLISFIITTGFFTGFYVVPLFTLLQDRAPKSSKGDVIATSNLINVTGAILASFLFFIIVKMAHLSGVCPEIQLLKIADAKLEAIKFDHGRPVSYELSITNIDGNKTEASFKTSPTTAIDNFSEDVVVGAAIVEKSYRLGGMEHRKLYEKNERQPAIFDNHFLPRYLFLVAAFFTLATLIIIRIRMPDLFLRTILWGFFFSKYILRAHGLHNLKSHGPVLIVHEGNNLEDSYLILSATDRTPRNLFHANFSSENIPALINRLAKKHSLAWLNSNEYSPEELTKILARSRKNIAKQHAISLSLNGPWINGILEMINELNIPVVPVLISRELNPTTKANKLVYVNFGKEINSKVNLESLVLACREIKTPFNGETQAV